MTPLLKFQDAINKLLEEDTLPMSEKHVVLFILKEQFSVVLERIGMSYHPHIGFYQQGLRAIHQHFAVNGLDADIAYLKVQNELEDTLFLKQPEAFVKRWQSLNYQNFLSDYLHSLLDEALPSNTFLANADEVEALHQQKLNPQDSDLQDSYSKGSHSNESSHSLLYLFNKIKHNLQIQ